MTHPSEQFEGTPLIAPSTIEHPLYDAVVEACRSVYDPEIPVNIYDLGLIYTIDISGENAVKVIMTLTAPGCGMGDVLVSDAATKIKLIPEVKQVQCDIVFDPPWDQSMMSEEAKLETGML